MSKWSRKLGVRRTALLAGLLIGMVVGEFVAMGNASIARAGTDQVAFYQPVRGENFIAHERNRSSDPERYDVIAREVGRQRSFKVNDAGYDAANGGITDDSLLFQQWKGAQSDLYLFDLANKTRKRVPAPVNSQRWEYWPSLSTKEGGSGRLFLFGRRHRIPSTGEPPMRRILLFDEGAGETTELDRKRTRNGFALAPGQVSGDFAVWSKCFGGRCDVFRYQLSTKEEERVPNPNALRLRAASVTPEGIVFFMSSGTRCGGDVRLKRWNPGRSPTTLKTLPAGRDSDDTYAFAAASGGRQVLYESYSCDTAFASIVRSAPDVAIEKLTVRRGGSGFGEILIEAGERSVECVEDCEQAFERGTQVVLTADASDGSQFLGWGGACAGETGSSCTVTMNESKTVTADFEGVSHDLTVTTTGEGAVVDNKEGIDCGDDCVGTYGPGEIVVLTAQPALGSSFDPASWVGCDAVTATGRCRVTLEDDRTVEATFTNNTHQLTVAKEDPFNSVRVTSDPSGIDCGSDCTETYAEGTSVTLTAISSDPNAEFSNWDGCDRETLGGDCVVDMTAARTVTAHFTRVPRRLEVTPDSIGGGSGEVVSAPVGIRCDTTEDSCGHSFGHGTTVTLTAKADEGSALDSWTGCDSIEGSKCTVMMDRARTVTGTFIKLHRLTVEKGALGNGVVTSDPPGIDCGGSCSHLFEHNTLVTLTASPDEGSTFIAWEGCEPKAAQPEQCTATMTEDREVTATFAPAPAPAKATSTAASATRCDPSLEVCTTGVSEVVSAAVTTIYRTMLR